MSRRRWGVLAVALLLWLATGIYVVDLDEVGLVRRFGALSSEPAQPGLHIDLPWPLSRVDRIRTDETRQVSVGMLSSAEEIFVETRAELASEFFTGDQNLIHVQATAQYRISEPARFLYEQTAPETVLAAAVQSALAETLAARGVDDILTLGRGDIQTHVLRRTRTLADNYHLGVEVLSVELSDVRPPTMVKDAFRDVADARSDKERMIHDARSEKLKQLELATGLAQRILDEAEVYREQQVSQAQGAADYFNQILDELDKIDDPRQRAQARRMTMYRLWTESLARILPKLKRGMYIDPGDKVDIQIFGEEK